MSNPPTNAPGVALTPFKLPVRGVSTGGPKIRIEDAEGVTFAYVFYCDDDYGKQLKDTLAVARVEAIVAACNAHATLQARVETLEKQNAAMQAVVNAASVFENVESDDDAHDGMDEMFELFEAVKRYRAALNSTPSRESA